MHVLAADPRASVVRTDVRTPATQVSQGNMAVNDHSTIHHCAHTRRPGRSHSPRPIVRHTSPPSTSPVSIRSNTQTSEHPNTQTPNSCPTLATRTWAMRFLSTYDACVSWEQFKLQLTDMSPQVTFHSRTIISQSSTVTGSAETVFAGGRS